MTFANPIAWKGFAGINVFWPFGGPVASGGSYLSDPYTTSASGPFSSHITSGVMTQILAAGFDHVRLQVSVGPWVQLIASSGSTAALDADLDAAISALQTAGLNVLLSPYFSSYQAVDVPTTVLQGISTTAYLNFKTLMSHWASRYATQSPGTFAIELMNEPPSPGSFPGDWPGSIQPDLYAAVRTNAPNLTIVLTGANYSDLNLLADINPTGFDSNCLWTFHPFLPSSFCLQGASYESNYKYITGMVYPPSGVAKSAVIARMMTNVNADGTLTSGQKTAMISALTTEIGYFYSLPQNLAWLNTEFAIVTTWRKSYGLPASSIYAGEWGCVRQGTWTDSAGLAQGCERMSRMAFLGTLASAVNTGGFRNAVDHLDTYDYGLTEGSGETIGAFDPLWLEALMPAMLKTEYAD